MHILHYAKLFLQTLAPGMKMSNRKWDFNYEMEKILIRGSHGIKVRENTVTTWWKWSQKASLFQAHALDVNSNSDDEGK